MTGKASLKSAKSAKVRREAESMIPVEDKPAVEEHSKNDHPQQNAQHKKIRESACVFVTGLPFGMTERNLRRYMQQFGVVLDCRVHTCPKSGRTRGYGYVHFQLSEVARIAAQTMNNHLITGSIMKCRLIPGQFIKGEFFSRGDRGYHSRIKKNIDKINLSRRNDKKEKMLLKKRQKSAQKHLSKLQDPEITVSDLGLPEHCTAWKSPVVKKEVKPSKKELRAKQKLQQSRGKENKSLRPKSLVLTRKGKAAHSRVNKKSVKKNKSTE
ncbi:RNA recognition motif domain [Trinorchestia longiramus]|nr:RNA recognition motif domain [Trinorchestia longiramus]